MGSHPESEPQEVIQRLIKEQIQTANLIEEIRRLITVLPELDGHSLVGGLKALIKLYLTQKKRADELQYKLNKALYAD
tara:strand:- start:1401 stop:1634 length:234 start_codon:yes stop_codon:yes gene_type:complete